MKKKLTIKRVGASISRGVRVVGGSLKKEYGKTKKGMKKSYKKRQRISYPTYNPNVTTSIWGVK